MSAPVPRPDAEAKREWSRVTYGPAQLAGVLAGPVAFLLNLQIGYMLVPWACHRSNTIPIHVTMLACLALALGGSLLSWRDWRRIGEQWPDEGAGAVARSRFLAALGVMTGALFALVIIAQWIPSFILSPCQ